MWISLFFFGRVLFTTLSYVGLILTSSPSLGCINIPTRSFGDGVFCFRNVSRSISLIMTALILLNAAPWSGFEKICNHLFSWTILYFKFTFLNSISHKKYLMSMCLERFPLEAFPLFNNLIVL